MTVSQGAAKRKELNKLCADLYCEITPIDLCTTRRPVEPGGEAGKRLQFDLQRQR
jgi:hypothetical protein